MQREIIAQGVLFLIIDKHPKNGYNVLKKDAGEKSEDF